MHPYSVVTETICHSSSGLTVLSVLHCPASQLRMISVSLCLPLVRTSSAAVGIICLSPSPLSSTVQECLSLPPSLPLSTFGYPSSSPSCPLSVPDVSSSSLGVGGTRGGIPERVDVPTHSGPLDVRIVRGVTTTTSPTGPDDISRLIFVCSKYFYIFSCSNPFMESLNPFFTV